MPTLRNRPSNQKASSTTSPSDDVADSRTQSRNSNEGERNNSPEDVPTPRLLRDRASLAAKSASHNQALQQAPKQESAQADADKTIPAEREAPNGAKRVPPKGLAPTRVLSRRSSFRPQSLLKRERGSDEVDAPGKAHIDQVPPKTTIEPPNVAKKSKREEPKAQEIGLDLTKRNPETGTTNRMVTGNNSRVATGSNDIRVSPSSFFMKEKPNPAVRISLPSNAAASKSTVPTSINGSQVQAPKRFGLIPLGVQLATELRSNMKAGSSMLTSNSTSEAANKPQRINNQSILAPTDRRHTFNILIAVTGSVAAIKLIELIKKLDLRFPQSYTNKTTNSTCVASISIKVIMTEHAKHFVNKNEISSCIAGKKIEVYEDVDEWTAWSEMGDPVLHIELRKWADLCLIAPLDANTMAKLANGICDNLLTCVVRAWDTSRRLLYCPAMNPQMYNHPITKEHLCKLQSFGYIRIDCIKKVLACGDFGIGAMASVDTIIEKVVEALLRPVPRLISPTKPLLTQQPTYQIMSTSDRPAASGSGSGGPSGVNLIDRFRASDQVGFRTINNSVRSSSNGSPMNLLNSSSSQSAGFKMLFSKQPQHKVNGQDTRAGDSNLDQLKQGRSNFVQSLKNLKAINPDLSTDTINGTGSHQNNLDDDGNDEDDDADCDDDDDDIEDFVDDGGLELSSPEASNFGFLDPSKLLEQSLVTTDDHHSERHSLGGSANSLGNLSSASNHFNPNSSSNPSDPFTPFFNTSKFLTMCYVRERNCFNCAICKNDYKNRKSMSRHLREQHVQGNIYECGPCGVGFKRREKLMKHNRDKHGIEIEPGT